ncbi:MAG: maleylpyruvate isomerase N-terminal domain-containing protein [Mycobacterium sp.]|nr:maleylpyruvate isomerase N-terminal domain-containing protein [Mycobacterium sp.]
MTMTEPRTVFASAAESFAALVQRLPDGCWDEPGLGDWDMRSLVGHTSRSLITVSTYLQSTAQREDVATAPDYYVAMQDYAAGAGAEAIVERGRQAGRDLGEDPVAAIDALVPRVLAELDAVDDPLIEVIGGLGMRLSSYLPTRTFELAVHGMDIAAAAGIDFTPPLDVLAEAAALAARIGVQLGRGPAVLLALTGRRDLPPEFSVVF